MFVSDLKPNQSVDSLELEIIDKGEAKEFTNFRGKVVVANAKVKDDTGQCTLTLWNDEANKYSKGQKVRITNGWCKEYRGEIQVSAGRYGKIEIIGGVAAAEMTEEKPVKKAPAKKQAKKPAKSKKNDDDPDEEEDISKEDEIFPEAEKDPYIKYEKMYGKEF
ncbi:MAG: hypothetical protein V1703_01675 [Candidatus Altiarchaeota archaeon]